MSRAGRPVFETLEKKEMLSGDAPQVIDFTADNRGLVELVVDADLAAGTVNQNSVRFFDAGDDGLLGTGDDEFLTGIAISYSFGDRTITADAGLTAGTLYGVLLDGSMIRGTNGCFLDGEFNGLGTPTGDGVEGGDTLFYARQTGQTIARITTNLGIIDVLMFPDETPITVANFFRYANEGLYDRTFFHRNALLQDGTPFVIQGGGFEADIPFNTTDTFDPILNEPGVSNTRGTIALAKLGNNPNSGTNQFFFNLDDNGANLDFQNGGFTVFGEALDEESLAVIDAIAALENFDASDISGAFTDVPVIDLGLIESTSGILMPRDVVRIDRVAQLLSVSAEPFNQLDTDEVRTITKDGNAARVTLFSLSGVPLGDLDDFIKVSFSGNDSISSIRITGVAPGDIGIQISGASSVGELRETGRNARGLSFIVSSAPINAIQLKGTLTGAQINGVLLADSFLLPEDIDGDNRFDDLTAVYVTDGTTRQLRLDDGLTGDVLFDGGLRDLRVKGLATLSDIRLGANDADMPLSVRMDTVRDVVLETQAPISTLRVDEWRSFATQNASITAPSIANLRVNDDLGADLRVTGALGAGLGNATIRGDVLRSDWNLAGNSGNIRIGNSSNWTVSTFGGIQSLRAKDLRNTSIDASGEVRTFRVDSTDNVVLDLGGAINFVVRKGDLDGDVTIGSVGPVDLRTFNIGGDILNADIAFTTDVGSFKVKGDIDGSTINGRSFRDLKFKIVTDTDFIASQEVRQLRVTSWNGGLFQASEARAVRTLGDRRNDDPGDYNADLIVSNAPVVRIAGSIEDADIRLGDNRDFRVGGDIISSEVRFFRLFLFATISAVDITIEGTVLDSEVYADSSIQNFRADAMIDSALYVGTTNNQDRFGSAGAINPNATVDAIILRGLDNGGFAFQDSFISVGAVDYVRLTNPDFLGAQPFGIATRGDMVRVEVISDDLTRAFNSPSEGVIVMDELELRPGFRIPTAG